MKSTKDVKMKKSNLEYYFGKMLPEFSAQIMERILELSSKKSAKLPMKTLLFLNLKNGPLQESSWEKIFLSHGEYSMLGIGESPKDVKESTLSQILEENPHPKYSLSATACEGILRRAKINGKILTKELETALKIQAGII